MDYNKRVVEVDEYLKKNGIYKVRKADLKVTFGISKDHQSAIWLGLAKKGWSIYYSHLERPLPVSQ